MRRGTRPEGVCRMEFGRGGGGNFCSWDCALIRAVQAFTRLHEDF